MSRLREDSRRAIEDSIARHELGCARDLILEKCSDCVAVVTRGSDNYARTGNTRYGGDPDLPADWAWPRHVRYDGEERHANFLCQINFAEVPIASPPLPTSGIFYLFVEYMESAAEPVLVDGLFYDGPLDRLERRQTPPHAQLLDDEYLIDLKPVRASFRPSFDCDLGGRSFRKKLEALATKKAQPSLYERFRDFCFELPSSGGLGQLLGYANAVDDDLARQVALSRLGARKHQFCDYWGTLAEYEAAKKRSPKRRERYERMRPGVDWLLENSDRIAAETARWQQLLRIPSNPDMDLWINDSDPLYVFIEAHALTSRRFDSLAAEVTQG